MDFRTTPEQAVDVLREFFTDSERFDYEKALGHGYFGVTARILDKKTNPPRKLAVKRALGKEAETELELEIKYLKTFRGAMHIVQLLASRARSSDTTILRRLLDRLLWRGKWLNDLPGPTIVMECLEGGDLDTMMMNAFLNRTRIPNRMLWAIFLCLVRACVGIAYPPKGSHGAPVRLETIPAGNKAPSRLSHRDIRPANVMVGPADPHNGEHSAVPVIKIIDFGIAEETIWGDADSAARANLLSATKTVMSLITHFEVELPPTNQYELYNGMETYATLILNRSDYPDLDEDLRMLIVRCCARNRLLRPGLAEMLRVTKQAVQTKTPQAYGRNQPAETDNAIRNVMQILSMNATNETLLGADGNTSTVHCSLSSWQSVNDYQQLVWE